MYKLLIVDDEASVRSGLRECVDWKALGITIIGEAEDGEIALQMIQDTNVDIILMDVRMPHMDGIALAGRLKEQYSQIKIVFISGFGDVEYLKQALKLEAIDYILKPVRILELNEVLKRVVQLLDEEELQLKHLNALQIKLNQSIPLLRERYLTTLVLDGVSNSEGLAEKFHFLGIRLPVDSIRFGVFVIRVDDYSKGLGSLPEKERQLISFALLNISEDIVNDSLKGHVFEVKQGEYAGLIHIHSDSEEEALFTVIQQCKEQINRLLKLEITIGVGMTITEWQALPEAYRLASEAAEHKWYLGKNQIITMDSLAEITTQEYTLTGRNEGRSVSALLKGKDWDNVQAYVENLFGTRGLEASFQQARIACMQTLTGCSELLLELNLTSESLQGSERQLWTAIPSIETIAELQEALLSHLKLLFNAVSEKREKKTRNVVGLIQQYINEHYAEELTNADIAASVFLTTTYVCLLFKQETGMTLNEYVIEKRLLEAKRLLADPRNKLYDVCYAVGYKDPGYFGKLFKKQTGHTPGEFREKGI
jgi:two-component system response regulator YesN